MAVNGLLRVFSGNAASSSEVDSVSATTVADQAHRAEILDDFEKAGNNLALGDRCGRPDNLSDRKSRRKFGKTRV